MANLYLIVQKQTPEDKIMLLLQYTHRRTHARTRAHTQHTRTHTHTLQVPRRPLAAAQAHGDKPYR